MSLVVAQVILLASIDGGAAAAKDVHARVDQKVELHVALKIRDKRGCKILTDAPGYRSRCAIEPLPAKTEVKWFKVEPTQAAYDNTSTGRFAFASLGYESRLWREGPTSVVATVDSLVRRASWSAGTMRFAATVRLPTGETFRSRQLPGTYVGGPAPKLDLRKVVLRLSDDYLGYLSELTNLPYIFGSAKRYGAHQAELGIGVDCADLAVYGLRRMGHDTGYRSSRTLAPVSRLISAKINGRRGRRYVRGGGFVRVGPDGVRPGDWIVFPGHVGVFVEDRGDAGFLDSEDLMFHTAWNEPRKESLAASGWGDYVFEIRRARVLAER